MYNKNLKGKIVVIVKITEEVVRGEWDMKNMKKKKRINEGCLIIANERV